MNARATILGLLLVLTAFAGCFGDDRDGDPAAGEPPEPAGRDRPTAPPPPRGGAPADGPVAAPAWQVGQWWTWEVSGRGFDPFELTTVVGRVSEDGGAHMGSPELPESLHAHILHVPPLGAVTPTLGWHAHGEDMELIDFPLVDGKNWTGSLEGRELSFVATEEMRAGGRVFVVDSTYTSYDGQGPRYVYDPGLAMFTEVHLHYGGSVPFSSARLVDAGLGYEGELRLPMARDKFLDGAGGVTAAAESVGTFAAPPEKVWLVFACYLGGETGRYGITYVTPSPNEDPLTCTHENDQPGFVNDVQVMWRASVPGDWTILFSVVGNGYAEAEVIGVVEERCRIGSEPTDLEPCS